MEKLVTNVEATAKETVQIGNKENSSVHPEESSLETPGLIPDSELVEVIEPPATKKYIMPLGKNDPPQDARESLSQEEPLKKIEKQEHV